MRCSIPTPSGPSGHIIAVTPTAYYLTRAQTRHRRVCPPGGGNALTLKEGGASRELKVPVKLVGVGEGIDDLKPFEAREFVEALI